MGMRATMVVVRPRLVLLLAIVLSLMWGRPASALSLQEVAAQTKPSVVLLTISNAAGAKVSTGTGFFVSADGRVVTNHHVIEGAAKVTATLADGRRIDALGCLAYDGDKDLAIVKLPGEGYPFLALGESEPLRAGDDVVVIGSPMGLSGSLSAGIVSAIRDAKDRGVDEDEQVSKEERKPKAWGIQITAPISPGSSGSPILTLGGQVVAIAVGRFNGGESLNFGIPVEEAKALLAEAGPNAKPKVFPSSKGSSSDDVKKNLVISAALLAGVVLLYYAIRAGDRYRLRRRQIAARPKN